MIYLNNAATSWPKAPGLADYMKQLMEHIPVHGSRATGNADQMEVVDGREELAALMQVSDASRIVFMENATHGLNAAMLGFAWKEGDYAVTSRAEHNSVLRPLTWLKKHRGVRHEILPVDRAGRIRLEQLETVLKERHPRLVALTHASNVTGAVHDLEEIAALCHSYGSFLLADASQSMGIRPVLPEKWQVDMVAFTGHKYLLGPQGTGGLYVRKGLMLEPTVTGGTGIFSDEDEMPEAMPMRLEAGTQNEQGLSGLGYAVRWQREHPLEEDRMMKLFSHLENQLLELGADIVTVGGERTPVLSFGIPGYSPEEIGDILYGSYEIICRTGLHCAPLIFSDLGFGETGSVRISMSRFTSAEEIEQVVQAVKEIVSE